MDIRKVNYNNNKLGPCITFCEIRLDSYTIVKTRLVARRHLFLFIYTHLVTRLYSSTLVYIRPNPPMTRLHSSSFVCTHLVTRLSSKHRSNFMTSCHFIITKSTESIISVYLRRYDTIKTCP